MSDDSFIVPQFKPFEQILYPKQESMYDRVSFYPTPNVVKSRRADRKLTFNHYNDCAKRVEIEPDSQSHFGGGEKLSNTLEQKLINGYDGYGGVHDNLVWNVEKGFTYYTLNNKFIIEDTKTRQQTVFAESSVQLSCISVSPDWKLIAVAEGRATAQGNSLIRIYDLETKTKKHNDLNFHQHGIQSMDWSKDSQYLVSIGVQGDDLVGVWDVRGSTIVKSGSLSSSHATNMVKVDPHTEGDFMIFMTVGNDANLTMWRLNLKLQDKIESFEVEAPPPVRGKNFTSIAVTQRLPEPVNSHYYLIGTDSGILYAFDQTDQQYVEPNQSFQVVEGEIGQIVVTDRQVVFSTSCGNILWYPLIGSQIYPDMNQLERMGQGGDTSQEIDSAIVSMSIDAENNEGLVGTEAGSIFYVQFKSPDSQQWVIIKLVSSNNVNHDAITYCKFDPSNQNLLVTSCGKKCDELKLFTSQNCDQVMNFQSDFEADGYVVFVISNKDNANSKKIRRLVGFSNGVIKRFNFDSLSVDVGLKVELLSGEKLTCGYYSENNLNFAVGTNYGNVFLGSIKQGKSRVLAEAIYCKIDNICKQNTFIDKRGS